MHRLLRRCSIGLLFVGACSAQNVAPSHPLTWQETLGRFKAKNPTLLAGALTIDEARAEEITAYLRPNPDTTLGWDQLTPFNANPYRPVSQSYLYWDLSYLHEREHKRELRLASAREGTAVSISAQKDLERNLIYNLRDAFNRVLLSKEVVSIAREDLDFYDKQLAINKQRFQVGDLAKVDFQRLELQRAQFQSDLINAQVNLRTAKVDLLALLRDNTPVDQFDVTGEFGFSEPEATLPRLRSEALNTRPDLKQAQQSLEKARIDHKLAVANGSADPTIGVDLSHQPPPLKTYLGFYVNLPIRIFDRNQGEKAYTQLDIGRNEKLRDAAEVSVTHDVDSAYATLESTVELLRPYKESYLKEADDVRATVSFAYQHGAASLLDFLDAQREYRDTELAYVNLVGSYLSAANQVNLAVGREVIE
jgi:cobalt-zinc-cadmium efflux system outer membrane protein